MSLLRRARRRRATAQKQKRTVWILSVILGAAAAIAVAAILLGQPPGPEIRGDVVIANNTRCPMSGRLIPPDLRERWRVELAYDGPLEAYRGRTLVLNTGSAECAARMPELWRAERDAVIARAGLAEWLPD